MSALAKMWTGMYALNVGVVKKACQGITTEEAQRRVGPVSNPFGWLVGHIVTYRSELCRHLGVGNATRPELMATFGRDVVPPPDATFPDVAPLVVELGALQEALAARLLVLGDSVLDITRVIPGGATSSVIAFMHFHETYHCGQLGYLRKWLGKSPIVGPADRR